jgi:hypothetical protein
MTKYHAKLDHYTAANTTTPTLTSSATQPQ